MVANELVPKPVPNQLFRLYGEIAGETRQLLSIS